MLLLLLLIWKKGDVIEEKMLKFVDKVTPKRFKKQTSLSADVIDDQIINDNETQTVNADVNPNSATSDGCLSDNADNATDNLTSKK